MLEATDTIRFFEIIRLPKIITILKVREILEPQKGHQSERKLEII